MAEVSNLHRINHPQEEFEQEGEFYLHPDVFIDSFCLTNNFSRRFGLDDNTASFDLNTEPQITEPQIPGSEVDDPKCLSSVEEDGERANYVTDLFESRETHSTEEPVWEFDSESVDDSGSEFGFGAALGPDSEDFEVNLGFMNNDVYDNNDAFWANDNSHICANERDEFEWEEVSERIHIDERENLNSVIDRIEEISISSDGALLGENSQLGGGREEGEEEDRNLEWEVLLLEVNDLYRNFELDSSEDRNIDGSDVAQINIPEDNIFAMEYDTIFGQAMKGSPPAAKSVVENLPFVVLTKEEPGENGVEVICAVCKDEVAIGEKLTRMPCCHLYHRDCILPWLRIRNTCPVCRHELPTDDADYERSRNERGGSRVTAEVRYNFELLI